MSDFFHPYIDPEPSPDLLREVDRLVVEEMESCEHPLEIKDEQIEDPKYVNFIEKKYSETADYQNMLHRESLARYILKNQSLYYHNLLNSLDEQTKYLQILESKTKEEIDVVLQKRYDEQAQAAPILKNLQAVSKRTKEGISRAEEVLNNIS